MFMQIHISTSTIKEMQHKWELVPPTNCYNEYFTLDIL